ncbi:TIR domain-containing protein [Croceibacterium salegens]|uniref:TIR domain-containing protein n=1 Tax=Croceibacterium salegens TaxID=1737568 RepID=UPI000AA48626|nr:TIR domain-containing protein [Croceibacterium salegens]
MAGPDIFLSYNREDAARAKHFADGFAAQGLDVWWDVALRSGEAYDQVTEEALRNAKAVVVLWSPRSVVSRWVRAEATLADRHKTLMPAMIEPCERPIMFELVQTAELSHWMGDADDPAWQDFARHVREFVGKGGKVKSSVAPAPKRALPSKPSIAVLPFLNLSGDPEQEYFADGVVDDIISALTRFNQLFVIARSSSFTYKGRQVDCRTVADELGVRFVLEGSIRKAGNRLRISGHLVDVQSGEHLWADKFDGALEDVFDLQDQITEAVVGAIAPTIQRNEMERARRKPPESLDAYELYLRALPMLWDFAPETNAPAIELLEAALKIDPDYPQALAFAAWAYEQRRWFESSDNNAAYEARCMELVHRCLKTQTKDADVIALCAFMTAIVGGDLQAAREIKDRALLFNANAVWTNFYCSMVENYTGNSDRAIVLAERAIRQNPLDPNLGIFLHALAMAIMAQERWEEALPVWERTMARKPDWVVALAQGIVILVNLDRLDDATRLGRKILALDPNVTSGSLRKKFFKATALDTRPWIDAFAAAGIPE